MNKTLHAYFYLIFITLLAAFFLRADNQSPSHLPVVLVSGLDDDSVGMIPMANLVKKHVPGVYVKNVHMGLGKITSFWNMKDQAEWLASSLYNDYNLRNGCNIIAHSQGGLVARYFIQRYNYPRVYNYIALGSPQRGIDAIPSDISLKYKWLNLFDPYLSGILYMSLFQSCVSFAGYWHDSVQVNDYLTKCIFLPYLNNEKPHNFSALFKENISKLQNMVLVQATQEETVEPAASCHFGFYKQGSATEIEDLFASVIYTQDTLGLKQLYENGCLHLREAQCNHAELKTDEHNFVQNILPFLLLDQSTTQPTTDIIEVFVDSAEIQVA